MAEGRESTSDGGAPSTGPESNPTLNDELKDIIRSNGGSPEDVSNSSSEAKETPKSEDISRPTTEGIETYSEHDRKAAISKAVEDIDKEIKTASGIQKDLLEVQKEALETAYLSSGDGEAKPTAEAKEKATPEDIERAKARVSELQERVGKISTMGEEPSEVDAEDLLRYVEAQEELASLDKTKKVGLTIYQAEVIKEDLIAKRAVAKLEGNAEQVDEINQDLTKIRGYERKLRTAERKQEPTGPATVDRDDVRFEVNARRQSGGGSRPGPGQRPPGEDPITDPPSEIPGEVPPGGEPPNQDPPAEDPPENPSGEPSNELTPEDVVERLSDELDKRINDFAAARVEAEKILASSEDKERLAKAEEALNEAFNNWSEVTAIYLASTLREKQSEISDINTKNAVLTQEVQDLEEAFRVPGGTAEQKAIQRERIDTKKAEIEANKARKTQLEQEVAEIVVDQDRYLAQRLVGVRQTVDSKMLEIRTKQHPKLVKFTKWIEKHPMVKTAVGLGLLGAGIVGVTIGAPAAVIVGIGVARAGVAAFGAYTASRGAGEVVGNRFVGSENSKQTIEEETAGERKQSTSRRWSKRAGAAAAAFAGIFALTHMPTAKPPTSTGQRWDTLNPSGRGGGNPLLDQARAEGLTGSRLQESMDHLRGTISYDLWRKIQALPADKQQIYYALTNRAQNNINGPVLARFLTGVSNGQI